MNVTLLRLHVASVVTRSAVVSQAMRTTSTRFSLHGSRFNQLLCPVAMIPQLRATVTTTSIRGSAAPYVFESTDYSNGLFSTQQDISTLESYFKFCLFEDVTAKSLVKYAPSAENTQCVLDGCIIRRAQLVDKIIEGAHNSTILNTFMESFSGALNGPCSMSTDFVGDWELNIQGVSMTGSSLGGRLLEGEIDINGDKTVIISDRQGCSSMNITHCFFSQHLILDNAGKTLMHHHLSWRHCMLTDCTVDAVIMQSYHTVNCLMCIVTRRTQEDAILLENVFLNNIRSNDENVPIEAIFLFEINTRIGNENVTRAVFTDMCCMNCGSTNSLQFNSIWGRTNTLGIFTRCYFETLTKPRMLKTEAYDVDFAAQKCPLLSDEEIPAPVRRVFDYGIIGEQVEQFEVVNI